MEQRLNEIIGGMLLMCQNITMWVYGAWIKTYYVLSSKTYSTFGNVLKSTASLRQAARSNRIYETRLLCPYLGTNFIESFIELKKKRILSR